MGSRQEYSVEERDRSDSGAHDLQAALSRAEHDRDEAQGLVRTMALRLQDADALFERERTSLALTAEALRSTRADVAMLEEELAVARRELAAACAAESQAKAGEAQAKAAEANLRQVLSPVTSQGVADDAGVRELVANAARFPELAHWDAFRRTRSYALIERYHRAVEGIAPHGSWRRRALLRLSRAR